MERGLARAAKEECRRDICVKTGQRNGEKGDGGGRVSSHCGVREHFI